MKISITPLPSAPKSVNDLVSGQVFKAKSYGISLRLDDGFAVLKDSVFMPLSDFGYTEVLQVLGTLTIEA